MIILLRFNIPPLSLKSNDEKQMFSIIKPVTSRENGLIIAEIQDLLQHEMNIGQSIRFAYFIFNKSQDENPSSILTTQRTG